MSHRTGKCQSFLASLQSLIWVTKMPERYAGPRAAGNPGVLHVDKRMRAVPLGVVERNRLLRSFPGGAQLSEPERRIPKRTVRLDEEGRISCPLRNTEKALAQLACCPMLTTDQVECQQSVQDGEGSGASPICRQRSRARV